MASPHLLQDLHQRAIELYAQGKLEEAAQFLSDSIAEKQTSELWNDWAAVQARLGNFLDSERGFRCALPPVRDRHRNGGRDRHQVGAAGAARHVLSQSAAHVVVWSDDAR